MTEINIDSKNKTEYTNGSYPEVTSIKWRIGELDENILKNFPNLVKLNCFDAKITDLSPLQSCKGLTELICSFNKITDLSPLQSCTGLTKLYCSYNTISDLSPLQYCTELFDLICNENQITDLSPLQYCTGLTELSCRRNQITDLSPLQYCKKLTKLRCNINQITDVSSLQYCKVLTEFDCCFNRITDLTPLQYCKELTELYCSRNKIIDLSPLQYCKELTALACNYNEITSLESIIYLRRLIVLHTYNNPLNPPSIQVGRFLERIRSFNNDNSIYSDTQNVHDVKVQQSVMDSVRNLMKDKLPNKKITLDIDSVLNSELKASTKSRLLEYFEDNDVHVVLLITYKELFTYVWNRIINNPNKLELLKILDDNIQDSKCKCFTGRFNRTLSTLVGFYDDIEINISDNSRIGAIISQIKDSIIPYDPDKHEELSKIRLLEAGYDSEIIDLWTSVIEE